MNPQIRNIDSTNCLTQVASECTIPIMRFVDIEKRLNQQYAEDEKQLRKNYSEQNKLRPHVVRFHDLEREAKAREERMARVLKLLGDEKFLDTRRELLKGEDVSKEVTVFVEEKLPLWLAMRAIVEQATELQVVDLQDALEYFKVKASRQAIESALASHKETFETKVRNREKFVSLKR
ncbi:MAG TPA: hypothetical protein VNX26_01755 [Candidatus Acidoferrum sp.]|jgi:hypothetical protein|nr:hypothetical protein [Candidatus Acidoferrum sp.]